MNIPIRLLVFLVLQISFSQQAQIIDAQTQTPIANTAVFNNDKTKTQVSDQNGIVNLTPFKNWETINFKHLSYISTVTTKTKIIDNKYRVMLTSNLLQLEEIVISASKWQQQKKDIPQKVKTISKENITFTNPQTAADLLQNNGNIFIQKSQLGGGSPMIRGFATNRILITVDGIRMNNAIFRGGNVQNIISIDPLAIKKTEVIFGPGSVIYGSDAIGGTINFFTTEPVFSGTDPFKIKGSVLSRYASANQEKTIHTDINIGLKKWAFVTSISYTDFEDLKMGKYGPDQYLRTAYVQSVNGQDITVENTHPRIQKPTGYHQINLLQKIKHKPNDHWVYTTGIYYSATSDYSRYDRLIRYRENSFEYARWYYGPQQWFLGNLQMTHTAKNTFFDHFKITTAYQYYKESRNERGFMSGSLFNTTENLNAISSNLDFEKKITPRYTLFYGLEYIYNSVNSSGYELEIATGNRNKTASRYPDGATWKSAAAYVSLEFKPHTTVAVSSGLRYNHTFIAADFSENNTFYNFPFTKTATNTGALTGTAGVSWQPDRIFQWKLHFSTAFRSPNIDDIGKIFDPEPGSVIVPNPTLKPEYAYHGEFELQLNFNKKTTFNISTYYTHLHNALVRRPFSFNGQDQIIYNEKLSDVQAIQNATKARVLGIEAALNIHLTTHLNITSDISYNNGHEIQEDRTETPLRHTPPLFGSTHLIWKSDHYTIDVFTHYNGEISFDNMAPSERSKEQLYAVDSNGNPYAPSWYTLNLKTQYRKFYPFSINFGIENITNQRYKTYSSGIVAPGINIMAGVIYHF